MNAPRLMLGLAIASMAAGALVACPHRPGPTPDPVPAPDRYDGGHPGDAGPATCASVCAHWGPVDAGGLGCAEGADPQKCVAVCANVVANNDIVPWNLECRAHVAACDQIDRCEGDITEQASARRPAATCASACANVVARHCAPAATPHDAGCPEVCENAKRSGFAAWDLPCLTAARSCAAVTACGAR